MSTPRKKVPTPVNLSDGDNNPISVIAQARDIDGVIPISKGGSGLSKIEGGKLLASSESGAFFEEIDVNPHHLSGITENIQFQLDGFGKQLENVSRLYQVQIPDVFDDYIEIFCRLEAPTIPITIGIICT